MRPGFFITVEGIDRSGKSTQVERLCSSLCARGLPVGVLDGPDAAVRAGGWLREPGGTPTGEAVRDILLHRRDDVAPWAEALLYAAARAQLVRDVVAPSLAAGLVVVLDRYVDSSLAYQGHARGLGVGAVLDLNLPATGGLLPDLTVLLRIDAGRAARRPGGPPDRLEAEGRAFQVAVAAGYDALVARWPDRIRVVDGEQPLDAVAADVERLALDALAAAGFGSSGETPPVARHAMGDPGDGSADAAAGGATHGAATGGSRV